MQVTWYDTDAEATLDPPAGVTLNVMEVATLASARTYADTYCRPGTSWVMSAIVFCALRSNDQDADPAPPFVTT